jgi:hypothetical protein
MNIEQYTDNPILYLSQQLKDSLSIHESPEDILERIGDEGVRFCIQQIILFTEIKNGHIDLHGRFDENTITGNIFIPKVNQLLRNKGLSVRAQKAKIIFTHDIDWVNPLNAVSFSKSIYYGLKGKSNHWLKLPQNFSTGIFFDITEQLLDLEKRFGVHATYFMMSGPYGNGRHDTRYAIEDKQAKRIVKLIKNEHAKIGLHGSYHAREKNSYKIEKERIEQVSGTKVCAHRNHYLRFDPVLLPSQLEKAEIGFDFSVGFTNIKGFRSGCCTSYKLIDTLKSAVSSVTEIPLIVMDRLPYLNDGEVFFEAFKSLLNEVKSYGGSVSILTHPENFIYLPEFWKFYERMIEETIVAGIDVSGNYDDCK